MAGNELKTWALYNSPTDFPGEYVAREFVADQPTDHHFSDADLNKVQRWIDDQAIKAGVGVPVRIERDVNDDPNIVCIFV